MLLHASRQPASWLTCNVGRNTAVEKRLKILLIEGWTDISRENPDGPRTFRRAASENPGVLQISVQATYSGGRKPDPTTQQLIGFAAGFIQRGGGQLIHANSGECKLGLFGAVQGALPGCSFMRVWVLSNGYDFVLATQTVTEGSPDQRDLDEGHSTVMNIDYR